MVNIKCKIIHQSPNACGNIHLFNFWPNKNYADEVVKRCEFYFAQNLRIYQSFSHSSLKFILLHFIFLPFHTQRIYANVCRYRTKYTYLDTYNKINETQKTIRKINCVAVSRVYRLYFYRQMPTNCALQMPTVRPNGDEKMSKSINGQRWQIIYYFLLAINLRRSNHVYTLWTRARHSHSFASVQCDGITARIRVSACVGQHQQQHDRNDNPQANLNERLYVCSWSGEIGALQLALLKSPVFYYLCFNFEFNGNDIYMWS